MRHFLRVLCLGLSGILPLVLTGCTLSNSPDATPTPEQGMAIQGRVYGGQAPLEGAQIYLLEASISAYGGPGIAASASNASTSLIQSTATGATLDTAAERPTASIT